MKREEISYLRLIHKEPDFNNRINNLKKTIKDNQKKKKKESTFDSEDYFKSEFNKLTTL